MLKYYPLVAVFLGYMFTFFAHTSTVPPIALGTPVSKPLLETKPIVKTQEKEFELKGIRFGMTGTEISNVIGKKVRFNGTGFLPTSFTIGGILPDNYFRAWFMTGTSKGYDIGGTRKGTIETESRVYTLYTPVRSKDVDSILERLTNQYGTPSKLYKYVSTNLYNTKLDNYMAIWDLGSAEITLTKYDNFEQGSINIVDKSYMEKIEKHKKTQEQIFQKDF
ncbi:MAG: hypothetical protein ACK5T0_02945 [Vampirovibrionales bacterium]